MATVETSRECCRVSFDLFVFRLIPSFAFYLLFMKLTFNPGLRIGNTRIYYIRVDGILYLFIDRVVFIRALITTFDLCILYMQLVDVYPCSYLSACDTFSFL